MHIKHTGKFIVIVYYQQGVDLMLLHNPQRLRSKDVMADSLAIVGHDVFHARLPNVVIAFEHAAQITVGKDPFDFPLRVHDGGQSKSGAGHFDQRLGKRRFRPHNGHLIASVHEVVDFQKKPAS